MSGDQRLLAVDPGIRGCGVAVFDGATLVWAGYVPNPLTTGDGLEEVRRVGYAVLAAAYLRGSPPWRVVVERPQVYFGTKSNPNHLLNLTAIAGVIVGRGQGLESVDWVLPRVWKGNVSKEETETLVQQVLGPNELARVTRVESHDAWDAIGIGLYDLGRLVPMHRGRESAPSARQTGQRARARRSSARTQK